MGIIDAFIAGAAAKRMTKPFKEWKAYKLGLIDENGNQIREVLNKKDAKAWTSFDQFCARFRQLVLMHASESQAAEILSADWLLRN